MHIYKNQKFITLLIFLGLGCCRFSEDDMLSLTNSHYITNQPPLVAQPYTALPLGKIKANGWLLTMLENQRDGLSGNLDSVYSIVCGSNNGWLGGTGDSWERGPYWIDGLVPLAYILDDQELKAKSQKWIDWSIENQRENGYFGPYPFKSDKAEIIPGTQQKISEDWWPKMVMLKALQQYYSATQDKRVINLMTKYFKYQLDQLPENPLDKWTFWAGRRGGDNLQLVYWLYNITKEPFLLDLGELLHQQTYDWTGTLSGNLLRQSNPYADIHCVNLAQGLKEPVIYYQSSGQERHLKAPLLGLEAIKETHGFANGMYGGDEALHGNDPMQGSEFCSAVEMMFSLESMLPITGDTYYADYLEKIAFNVVPTQHNDSFTKKQYFQQPNQIKVTLEYRNFNCEYHGSSTLFGINTGYPCCVTNMHQGWPKFTQNLYYATRDNGIASLLYAPSSATITVADGVQVEIVEETDYPFQEIIQFSVYPAKAVTFPFQLRIPKWCKSPELRINGNQVPIKPAGSIITINRQWKTNDKVELILPMEIQTSRWFEKSVAIERGPLLYALKMHEDWKELTKGPWKNSFYEVHSTSNWNYGIPKKVLDNNLFRVVKKDIEIKMPWNLENSPISIFTFGKLVPHWKEYNGSTGKIPESPWPQRDLGTEWEQIELIPYGATTLRISQFPVIDIYSRTDNL